MPIPKPRTNENRENFISRCMVDDVMVSEYPDEDQRYAICNSQKAKAMNSYLTTTLEIKSMTGNKFEGYGAVFGNVDYGGDIVVHGAFKRTLAEHRRTKSLPLMFWMHQMDQIPGKWLDMTEDNYGLYADGQIAETTLGKDVRILLDMKAVRGLSIGYSTPEGGAEYRNDGVRLLKDVDLHETSIVSLAMNPLASVTLMKARLSETGEWVPEIAEVKRKIEHFLRSEGISKSTSRLLVSNMFKASTGETPDGPGEMPERTEKPKSQKQEFTGETPDEIELTEGLSRFQESQLMYELERRIKQYF